MKKLQFITLLGLFMTLGLTAQTNTFPTSGSVGIGTNNPTHELSVEGSYSPNIELKNSNYSNGGFILNRTNYGHQWKWWAEHNVMYFDFSTDETNYSNKFTIESNGNVGIGTNNPDSKLTVKGNIHTNEVKVDLLGAVAPDYVFHKDYDLKSLKAVEEYVLSNGHLPNIPSAKDMETEGIMLKEMNLKLLEKIEELTLYAIEQDKVITSLQTKAIKVEFLEEELQNQKVINENSENRLQKIEALLYSKK